MMKSTKRMMLCLATFGTLHALPAQQSACPSAVSGIDMAANEIEARIWTNGILFSDAEFQFNPNPNLPVNPSTIYAASLWFGGIDPGGNLKLNCPDYGSGNAAGPLDGNGATSPDNCSNWDRSFIVSGSQVAAFLANLPALAADPATALAQYKNVMGWPGRGNPYFNDAWGFDLPANSSALAPFYDSDSNGDYDPLKGDYPVVQLQGEAPFLPASIVWVVYNGSNNNLGMETQLTAWQFDCPDQPVLNRTLFTEHKMLYRGTEPLDSCYAAVWVDFDLGCYTDDYVGCYPAQDAFFAYNQDAVDGTVGTTCEQGIATFADNPPVQSVVMLSHSMDKFMYLNNTGVGNPVPGTTHPGLPVEYYRYLTGSWRDGTPLTKGGSGYNPASSIAADFAFPDPPSSPSGWTMCTSNLPFGDRKALGIHKIGQLLPGAINSFVTAWTVHPDVDLPCGIGNTLTEVEHLRNSYNFGFTEVCSPLTSTSAISEVEFGIFPNPATHTVTLKYGDLPVREIRLFSAEGRVVKSVQNIQPEQTVLELKGLNSGIYYLQIQTGQGSATRLVVIL